MPYVDSLLYGAILSSPEIYECNVKRLMKKFNYVAELYEGKVQNLGIDNMNDILLRMKISAEGIYEGNNGLTDLKSEADSLERMNDRLMYGAY